MNSVVKWDWRKRFVEPRADFDFLCGPLWNPPCSSAVSFDVWAINRREESEAFAEERREQLELGH